MQALIALAFICLVWTPAHGADRAKLAGSLKRSHPDVQWATSRLLTADLDCQGPRDIAVLGTQRSRLWVAVFLGGAHETPIVFEVDSSLLARQTTMSVESQDFESGTGEAGDVGPLPGFQRSKTCMGLRLDDDRIDSVHIYWNRSEGRFQTWQR